MKPLIVTAAAVLAAAAVVVGLASSRDAPAGPDPFAGVYPLVTASAMPSPRATWRPSGPPAGRLPVFRGTGSRVVGRITDRTAGVSYTRFGRPWRTLRIAGSTGRTAGEELDSTKKDYAHSWYVGVYSGPLDPRFDLPGPDHLRAAAELVGADFVHLLYGDGGRRTDLAGAPMTIDGHHAWVTAFRMAHPPGAHRVLKSQTEVVVALDTGHGRTAIVEITVPNNENRLLPDVNIVIRSLRVIR